MFRENNPGVSYGFRISEDNADLVEEAEKGKDSWVTTKVYERYQSHQPEYDNGQTTVTPQTYIEQMTGKAKHSNGTTNRGNKFKTSRSNKEKLERTTFHKDIFSGNYGLNQDRTRNQANTVDIDGIQNEASIPSNRGSRIRSQK